jgi:hypothetical protein
MSKLYLPIAAILAAVCTISSSVVGRPSAIREYDIVDYGARADGQFDNAPVLNAILKKLPATGGVLLVPNGDFLINSPLVIGSNFVTIKGSNRGWRSNVDAPVGGLIGPSGGSKLILGPAAGSAILVPLRPRLSDGRANRITGLAIRDLMIQGGGPQAGQTGIDIEQDGDGLVIDDVSCINLDTGMTIKEADASRISDCLVAECRNCVAMVGGIQNMVANCHMGAQPMGVTCRFSGESHLLVTSCELFPNGASAIVLRDASYDMVSNCVISGFFTGLIDIQGDYNALLNDSVSAIKPGADWPADPNGRAGDWGLVRIAGNQNTFTSSTVYSDQPTDSIRVKCVSGTGNRLSDLSIVGTASPCKVYVDADHASNTSVLFSAQAGETRIIGSNPQAVVYIPDASVR